MTETEPAKSRRSLTRNLNRELQVLIDLGILVGAFLLAYLLRFDFEVPEEYWSHALTQLPLVALLQLSVVFFTGIYSFVWRYVGMAEAQAFVRAAFYSAVPLFIIRLGLSDQFQQWRVPLSIVVLDTGLAFGGLLAARVLRRVAYERQERRRRQSVQASDKTKPVLLVGAGHSGILAVKEIEGRGDMEIEIVGFVDDDPTKLGTLIQGVRVLGTRKDLPRLIDELKVDQVVITIAEADAETIRETVRVCEQARVRSRIIPGLYEILGGKVALSRFRDVQIEDLLGREPVRLDEDEVRSFLTGKSVMVTGAGGSIGSELCRQAARFTPFELLLVERAEGPLFEVHREMQDLWPQLRVRPIVADVGDQARMRQVMELGKPHVVLHAAAHKHVPMMEDNPGEAIKNNVLATRRLGIVAAEAGVKAFVLISTDKAVRPASIMGATKRLAELVTQDLDRRYPDTRFVAVRFGNVMGSAGSVVPIFRKQIERGGPVTITHPGVTRYFMTIGEAAQLVLESGALGKGGEIMILDMGQPVKILDLAKDMIALSGFKPFEEIPISFVGLRPGEKLEEELALEHEKIDRTQHPKIFVGRLSPVSTEEIDSILEQLSVLMDRGSPPELRQAFARLLPDSDLGPNGGGPPDEAPSPPEELLH